jgi:tRNA1Val (adenine37-N6)-methyltransferase
MMLREKFPRGLSQPETGFRFSVDSLLLSCFMSPGQESRVADMGCGCGVIGLGLILVNSGKNIRVTGLDTCPDMISHCRRNADSLGLAHRFSVLEMDVSEVSSKNIQAESFDMAVANPPYRTPESGRTPIQGSRLKASFCDQAELDHFFRAGTFLLKNRGKIGIVFGAERLDELLESMKKHSLIPKRILPVYGNISKPSRIILVEGVKKAGPGLIIQPPLILYDKTNRVTDQALKFCPFLWCNPGR